MICSSRGSFSTYRPTSRTKGSQRVSDSHENNGSNDQSQRSETQAQAPSAERSTVPSAPPANDDTVSLLDLLAVLAKRWRLIFFTTFFAAIGIVLFSLYTIRLPADSPRNPMPNFYRSQAQILLADPGARHPGVSGALGSGDLGILAGLASLGRGEGEGSAALVQELLDGRSLIDQIVEEFDLLESFRESEFPLAAARRAVRSSLSSDFKADSGVLTISFESIDPVYATDVLQRTVALIESRFTFLTRDEARARTEAIESQLRQLEDDLLIARRALTDFQRRYGVFDPSSQGRQTVDLISEFRRQKFQLELEREQVFELVQDRTDPQIQRFNQNIRRIEQLISELETGYRLYSPVTIPLDRVGPLTAEYADLQRELSLKEQIFTTFQSELVRARIESQDTSRRFQVIEAPEVPLEKAGPNRGTISMIVTITAFFLSVFLAFVLEYFDRAQRDPLESHKIEAIKDQFRIRKRS